MEETNEETFTKEKSFVESQESDANNNEEVEQQERECDKSCEDLSFAANMGRRSSSSSLSSSLSLNKEELEANLIGDLDNNSGTLQLLNEIMELDDKQVKYRALKLKKKNEKKFAKLSKTMEINKAKWKKLRDELTLMKTDDTAENKLFSERIREIKSMCEFYTHPEYILYSLKPKVAEYALNLLKVKRSEFENKRRENWNYFDFFVYAGRMARFISFAARSHIKYSPWKIMENRTVLEAVENDEVSRAKCSINNILRLSLLTNPRFRTKADIQQILWFNRTVGAFSDYFPQEMEKDLAACISYETYEDNRILRCQGSLPHKLYYILSGKVEFVRVYKLIDGEVHRIMGTATSRQTTNFEDFENGTPSEYYILSRGNLEVLSLHKEDYLRLTNKSNSAVIQNFIQQISIFSKLEVNISVIKNHQVKIQYFRNEKVIAQSSAKYPYVIIIKSGTAVVVRQQTVVDEDIHTLLATNNVYSVGCKKDSHHASAMMGLSKRQRDFKESVKENRVKSSQSQSSVKKTRNITPIRSQTFIQSSSRKESDSSDLLQKSKTSINSKTISIQTISPDNVVSETLIGTKNKEKDERNTYVLLDTLKPFDIFGLETLEEKAENVPANLFLISNGAEIIMLSKRYILENIDNNTLLEIRKLMKSYITEEEAKVAISDDKKWLAYKKVLMQKMVLLHC